MNRYLYNLRRRFMQLKQGAGSESVELPGKDTQDKLRKREIDLYGEELTALRRLYEKWVSREHWKLDSEAVPLVLGLDPEGNATIETEHQEQISALIEHARYCISHNLSLSAVNREQDMEQWQVIPAEFY
ncbi:MAG: hypothetical protein MI673_08720, partial [Thiotrichales bacterium]|nr:hypothetical protein [Thiotrichales bacterium]